MRKTIFLAVLPIAITAMQLAGCGNSTHPQDTIKVGLIVELTGDMPAVGASSRNAAELAVGEINAAGGIAVGGKTYPVELVIEDNASKPDQSVAAANKLISQDNVVAIIGPNASLGAIPAAEIAEFNKTLLITPWSTNPKTTLDTSSGKPKSYVFRACYTDPFEGRVLARFATEKLGAKKAAVFYDVASEAPKSQADLFRQTFAELGGQIVAFETYTTGDRDFSAQLTKIKSAGPDIVFLPAYYNDVGLIAQQARRAGIKQPLVGSDAWSSPELIKLAGGAVEGDYFANHYAADIATPAAKKFIDAYAGRYGNTPDDVAALTYDAMGLLSAALKKSPVLDRKAVRDAMAAVADYEGVTGIIKFAPGSGDPVKSAVIMQVKGDKFVWVMNAAP
ncbi:ABC transporter substrate-binding protein [Methylomicrobium album]|uniref:ABC-type branched-chain amino acid transport system, periplasmic component n=1 Tax=Methylomicrobium album BG8 TaxID=686340 RepID=H8GP36_METAL|nr:ABC transporter substrate-binding protein [Methylomicrobium album]EIC29622.1 ABC-type branched-chain amino acid transport system, periplasmic component [Methylomicrobium album BG8]